MDKIKIENLNVYAHHGVYDFETKDGQNFYINLTLNTDTRAAGKSDNLELSTNYGEVCQFVTEWMQNNTCKLIETVAEKMAKDILLKFPLVNSLVLEINKPEAPIGLPFENVSVEIERGWHTAYLSIGSNMGDKGQYIKQGIKELKACEDIKNVKCSEIIVTKPYGGVEQDDFLNGAIECQTLLTPFELLEFINQIEKNANRERTLRWGPRTLDLDIIFYDREIVDSEKLIIPHVDMHNREFVLKPLAELAPKYRHPLLNKTVEELLKELN